MKLSTKAIKEFKKIYKDEFKTDLSSRAAIDMAIRLLVMFKAIYKNPNIKHGNNQPNN